MCARLVAVALLVASCITPGGRPRSAAGSDGGVAGDGGAAGDGGVAGGGEVSGCWVQGDGGIPSNSGPCPPLHPSLTWRISPPPPPRAIRVGDYLFIGNRHRLLQVVRATAGQEASVVAQIPLSGVPTRLMLKDETLLVLAGGEGACHGIPGPATCASGSRLLRFGVADPAAPRLTGEAALDGYCLDLVAEGTLALVGCIMPPSGRAVVQSVELAPDHLTVIDRRELAGAQSAWVRCVGAICHAAAAAWRDDWADTLLETARSDPESGALLVASTQVPGSFAGEITLREDLLRVWTRTLDGRVRLSWLDASSLEHVAEHALAVERAAVQMAGDHAFLLPWRPGYLPPAPLKVLDASSPDALRVLGELEVPDLSAEVGVVRPFGDRLVLLEGSALGLRLRLLGPDGAGEPALIEGITGFPEYWSVLNGPYWRGHSQTVWTWDVHETGLVTVRYRSAYGASAGVHVLRIVGDGLEPLGHFPTRDWGQDVELLEDGSLALYSDYSLEIADLADLSDTPSWTPLVRHVRDVATAGEVLVQLVGYFQEAGELLVTPSDAPATPALLARVPFGGAEGRLWARDGRAYALRQRSSGASTASLLAVDLTTPRAPRLGRPLVLAAEHCVLVESVPHHLACADRWRPTARVEIVDATRLEEPRRLAPLVLPDGSWVEALRARETILDVVSRRELEPVSPPPRTLRRYDLRDPSAPTLLFRNELPGYPLAWDGDTVFVREWGQEESVLRRVRIGDDGARLTGELTLPGFVGFSAHAELAVATAYSACCTGPSFPERPGELLVIDLSSPNHLGVLSRTSGWSGGATLVGRTLLVQGDNNVFVYRIDAQGQLQYERLFAGEPLRVLERAGRVFVVAGAWIEEVTAGP